MVYHHFQPGLIPPFSFIFFLMRLIDWRITKKSKYRSIHEQLLAFSFYLPATDRPLPPTLLSIDAQGAKSGWGAKNMGATILSPRYVPRGKRLCKAYGTKRDAIRNMLRNTLGTW
jgi:hypothetical protein